MPIYDRPVKALMKEFAAQLKPGEVFGRNRVLDWFEARYGKIKPATVRAHIESMSVNSNARRNFANVKPGSGHDLFYKLGSNEFRLWDAAKDGPPHYPTPQSEVGAAEELGESEVGSSEFALESDLRNYISKNLSVIEPGLKLYDDGEGMTGIEYPADGRRIDLLCEDKGGSFVVVELKVSRGYDRVIGQILRYMAWVKANLADNREVRGVIVASKISDDLKLAASLVPGVSLVEYEISFRLKPVA